MYTMSDCLQYTGSSSVYLVIKTDFGITVSNPALFRLEILPLTQWVDGLSHQPLGG